MDPEHPLRGGCSCGRNQYLIYASGPISHHLQILFDDTSSTGHSLSLRVPLARLRSTTHALYPEESHHQIRRAFTPHHAPHTKRQFCGFCGTALSHWSEEPREEADWICVNLGSLKNESVERLEEAGLLNAQQAASDTDETPTSIQQTSSITRPGGGRDTRGMPWFEEMVEGSELGRVKRRRGGETSSDGKTTVEWEVVEIGGEEEGEATSTPKHKISKIDAGDDVHMRG